MCRQKETKCDECTATIPVGERGPVKRFCVLCRAARRRKPRQATSACEGCSAAIPVGTRGKIKRLCKSCRDSQPRQPSMVRIKCDFCLAEFLGCRGRKWCNGCKEVFMHANKYKCEWCHMLFKIKGGKCAGRFCSNKCAGKARSHSAEDRRLIAKDLQKLFTDIDRIIKASRKSRRLVELVIAANERDLQRECEAVCRTCGKLVPNPYAANSKFCSRRCNPAERGSKNHTVRAKKRGLPRQYSITLPKVAERDGWMCMLCRNPVDRSLNHSHRMAASVDHVVPLNLPANTTHGHVWNNVQLAHRKCNEAKGCSIACPSLIDCIDPRKHVALHCIDQATPTRGRSKKQKACLPESPMPPRREFPTN